MKKLVIACLSLLFLLNACKKEEESTPQPAPVIPIDTVPKVDTTAKDTFEKLIEIKTGLGVMYMWLYKETPLHRNNFLGLADTNFFDNTTFHRCIRNFMIQGGDPNTRDNNPNNDGSGGPGYTIPAEILSSVKHERGAIGAARMGDDTNPQRESSGSQFYICLSTSGTQHLNGKYTVFGKILKGIEVADSVVRQKTDTLDRPLVDIKMDVNVLNKSRRQLRRDFNFYGYE